MKSVLQQRDIDLSTIVLIVVDNDAAAGAQNVVAEFAAAHPELKIIYAHEPQAGVSYARNRCLTTASTEWIAFLDDDEVASADWLNLLISSAEDYAADAVFGPVLPRYLTPVPDWLAQSCAHDRPRFTTGFEIAWGDARTGNVLFHRRIIDLAKEFDARLAKTGGEDSFFFANAQRKGAKLIWCNEATIDETVPLARMTQQWILQRALHGGRTFVVLHALLFGRMQYLKFFLKALMSLPIRCIAFCFSLLFKPSAAFSLKRRIYGDLGKLCALFYREGEYGK